MYINDLFNILKQSGLGYKIRNCFFGCFGYADDLLCVALKRTCLYKRNGMDGWPTERESRLRGVRRLSNYSGQFENFCFPAIRPWLRIRVAYRNLSYLPPELECEAGLHGLVDHG